MPITMNYEDTSGNIYTTSYWQVVQLNVYALGSINLTFYGYKDQAAFQAGKQAIVGAVKSYQITGDSFGSVSKAAPQDTSSIFNSLALACEGYALNTKDVNSGTKDSDGNPVMVSFFILGTQIPLSS